MVHATARDLGLRNYDVLTPQHVCTHYHRDYIWRQKLVMLQEPPAGGRLRDLAFHFRCVDKEGPDKMKNYPPDMADRLVELCLTDGYRVCCIGHPEYAYCPRAAEDLRALDLRETVAAISSVTVVVGENSGPMHLANLCGKPTVIWAAGQWRINYSLRWNHFGMPIFVVANDTHRPAPERVKQTIDEAMRPRHRREG
jgi:ADP-heptose:LPS heptosyltransferase